MPSPFPGMDPWLEDPSLWMDVHQSLIGSARDRLNAQFKPGFYAGIGERLIVEESDSDRSIYPDLAVLERGQPPATARTGTAVLAPDAPLVVKLGSEPQRQPFIEIRARSGHRILTVIEVLSPSNKLPGEGRKLYLKKQEEVLASRASLVEIDLLRDGLPTAALPEERERDSLYRVVTTRAWRPGERELYPFGLRERLPRVAIPVTREHGDVVLDLPSIFAEVYEKARYAERVDYSRGPSVPLRADDMAWARELVARLPS